MTVRLATGALYRKELRQVLRGVAGLGVENAYLVMLCVGAAAAGLGTAVISSPAWRVGSLAFWAVMIGQAAAMTIIIPTFAASLVTGEQNGNTWDILRSSPITARQVVHSKLLAAIVISLAILTVSVPVAAACFLLGGIPLPAAVWSFVVLFAGAAFATSLGLYCSTLVRRTAASVPIAAALGLGVLAVFGAASQAAPAIGAISPLQAVIMLRREAAAPLFGAAVPVWAASLVLWLISVTMLVQAAEQRLRHPHRQRQWGVRWPALILVALLALAALGSISSLSPDAGTACVAGTCAPPDPQQVTESLMGYAAALGHMLVFATVLLAAGTPTRLDELRARGEPLDGFGRGERWFGLSLDGGARFSLLLTGAILVVTMLGVWLWGGRLLGDHWASLLLAFIPVFAAVWAVGEGARCVGFLGWPRSDAGRKIIAVLLLIVLAVLSAVPGLIWARASEEPTFAGELSAVPVLFAGVASAFDLPDYVFETPRMQRLTQTVPMPFLTAAVYLILGLVLVAANRAIRRRWIRRQSSHELTEKEDPAAPRAQ